MIRLSCLLTSIILLFELFVIFKISKEFVLYLEVEHPDARVTALFTDIELYVCHVCIQWQQAVPGCSSHTNNITTNQRKH